MTLDNASRNSFAYDDTGFLGTTTTYSLILKNEEFTKILLTFLNSKVLDYYHKKNTIPQAGGFYRYQASFIEDLPIKYNFGDYNFLIVFANIIEYSKEKNAGKILDIVENSHISFFFE